MNDIPAFPSNITVDPLYMKAGLHAGMTLRDYFAGQVLAGVNFAQSKCESLEDVAKHAYQIADEMLLERGEK